MDTGETLVMARHARSRDQKALDCLCEALRAKRLQYGDVTEAQRILKQTQPEIRRLPANTQELFVRKLLTKAETKAGSLHKDGSESQLTSLARRSDEELFGNSESRDGIPYHSHDMIPSAKGTGRRLPPQESPARERSDDLPPVVRKRRRVRMRNADEADKAERASFVSPRPSTRFSDVGGIESILNSIRELQWALSHAEIYTHLGAEPPRGILLHGPSGCGKTLLANAIAGEMGVSFFKVNAPEIVSGVSGDSEKKLRDIFNHAKKSAPSIVFIDEVDAIAARREGASKDMERRIVAQLLSCIDDLAIPLPPQASVGSNDIPTNTLNIRNGVHPEKLHDTEEYPDVDIIDPIAEANDVSMHSIPDGPVEKEEPPRCPPVIVLGATNRPEALEPALRRAGRFDREIELGAPTEDAREAILEKLCRPLNLGGKVDLSVLASKTAGYVGADLALLTKEAATACVRRFMARATSDGATEISPVGVNGMKTSERMDIDSRPRSEKLVVDIRPGSGHLYSVHELRSLHIAMEDFEQALRGIKPSALREGFTTRPNVTWDSIGALSNLRETLHISIVTPIKEPERFARVGLKPRAGVLLYGPPGCGKTLLARAVASESGANFISVAGPELLSKYVGDSELAVRRVFSRARSSIPCIIFFDELDALAPRRGRDGNGVGERVVNMLLTEMDGVTGSRGVYVVGATNRADMIDPALLRPGRLDRALYVPLPDQEGRVSILKTLARSASIEGQVDLADIARDPRCDGFSGADLASLLWTAGEEVLMSGTEETCIGREAFERALGKIHPSVSEKDARMYEAMRDQLCKRRGSIAS